MSVGRQKWSEHAPTPRLYVGFKKLDNMTMMAKTNFPHSPGSIVMGMMCGISPLGVGVGAGLVR